MRSIHPSSYVSAGARLGNDVEIGHFSIVHENVILGDRVKIGAYCELGISTPLGDGTPLCIGDDSLIRSHSVFYESSTFGSGLTTGHQVIVREKTRAGPGFQIGAMSEIQGDSIVGNYVRLQSNVFVAKKTAIGNFVWILPYVVLTNDPTPPSNVLIGCIIEDYASIAAASVVLSGVRVGHHSLVAAARVRHEGCSSGHDSRGNTRACGRQCKHRPITRRLRKSGIPMDETLYPGLSRLYNGRLVER